MPGILKQKRSGYISLMAIVAALFIFVVGVGLLSMGFNRRMHSIRSNHQLSARSAADYGLTKAIYEMNQDLTEGVISDAALPAETGVTIAGSEAKYSYTVSGSMGSYSVQATGRSGSITKVVQCDLKLKGPFDYAILTKGLMDIVSYSDVDWFNFTADDENLKIGTTSIAPDTITLKPGSFVNGDLLIGQGGLPSVVVDDQGGTIAGTIFPVASDFDFVMPEVPDDLVSAVNHGTINGNLTLDASGLYRYENINLKNNESLTINGDVDMYITGNLSLDNTAHIDIDPTNTHPNAQLTIYLAGSLNGLNGSGFNNTTDPNSSYPAGDPHKLTVYGLSSNTSIVIKNSAVFCGVIYAPNANVTLHNGADIYGSVVANSYIQKNSATFWYDVTLRQVSSEKFTHFVPIHWREQ